MTASGLRTDHPFSDGGSDYGVDYASGWHNRVDVAARRALLTGFSQLTGHVTDLNAQRLGTDYFEVTWHAGARPDHAAWQGKVYTKEQLTTKCGLGTGPGLLGWNCRHTYHPFIPGVSERLYTDEWLEGQNARENTPRRFRGKEYTTYEATQKQRQMETAMRARREQVQLLRAGGADKEDISSMLPSLLPALIELISYVVTSLLDQLPAILDCALELILGLAQGILAALPVLIEALPEVISSIVEFLISAVPQIIDAGIELLMALVDALPVIIDALVDALPQIIRATVTALIAAAPQIAKAGIKLLGALIEAIPVIVVELAEAVPDIVAAIIDVLAELPGLIGEVFAEIVTDLVEWGQHIALPLDKRDGPRRQDQRVEAVVILVVPLRQHDLIDVLPHATVQLVDHLGNGVLMPLQIRAEPRKIPKPVDDAGTAGGQRQRPHRHHARFHQKKHDAQEHAVADVRHDQLRADAVIILLPKILHPPVPGRRPQQAHVLPGQIQISLHGRQQGEDGRQRRMAPARRRVQPVKVVPAGPQRGHGKRVLREFLHDGLRQMPRLLRLVQNAHQLHLGPRICDISFLFHFPHLICSIMPVYYNPFSSVCPANFTL